MDARRICIVLNETLCDAVATQSHLNFEESECCDGTCATGSYFWLRSPNVDKCLESTAIRVPAASVIEGSPVVVASAQQTLAERRRAFMQAHEEARHTEIDWFLQSSK